MESLEPPFKLVDGPSLTVDHILKLTKQPNITSFVEKNQISAVLEPDQDPKTKALYVEFGGSVKKLEIVKCSRVGITMKYASFIQERSRQENHALHLLFLPVVWSC